MPFPFFAPGVAARATAHRKRKLEAHTRMEIMLSDEAAAKLKAIARAENTTPSIIIERLLSDIPDPA
jgi:hypothetical protein